MKSRVVVSSLVLTFLVLCQICYADVRMPKIFSNNMVLQQKSKVVIWGWAEPGEKVCIDGSWEWLWGQSVYADKYGKWMVKINTPRANGPFKLVVKGKNRLCFENVMIGEVWVCSGQSNMEIVLAGCGEDTPIEGGKEEIANANYPLIRLFTVENNAAANPQENCNGQWVECSPKSVGGIWPQGFSAVAYFFGKELYKKLGVPIGLIDTDWGGTVAEAWTRREALENDSELKVIVEQFNDAIKNWKKAGDDARAQGKPEPPRPVDMQNSPSYLYNAMINPIIPYGIKGVIWYQGESNITKAYQYRTLFPALIKNWRSDWGRGDFPFYFVQLASYINHQPAKPYPIERGQPVDEYWAELREAQLMTLRSVTNTGMAVTIDIGGAFNVHPAKKKEVGQRLAYWALAHDYGKNIVCSGPIYKEMKVDGGRARISFDYAQSGLKVKGDEVEGVAIAGADRKFVWAKAKIEGSTVVVWSDEVKDPVAVRYAWARYPFCNLYSKEDLPASPFRTDNWPGLSDNNK